MSIDETRTTYREEPARVVETREVRESDGGSAAAWWIGALVAIVAIIAVVFMVTRGPTPTDTALTDAVEQGRMIGAMESAQAGLSDAQQAARNAADSAAAAAQSAADTASEAADDMSAGVSVVIPAEEEPVG